jgi:transcriptional regulator with GAF, ATPase, and Fis domain
VRGAFSGADRDQPGYAAQAEGGTLFLDEIGDLPLAMQPKLLRLLQGGAYQAIGDPAERRSDVRLIAATNADLAKLVAEGRFRADLYYRLRILELDLPPIRDRRDDVLPLLRHFLSLAAGRPVDPTAVFDAESLAAAETWSWPGNVREIAMIARRAHVALQTRQHLEIDLVDGPRRLVLRGPRQPARAALAANGSTAFNADDPERARIVAALDQCEGNRLEAARLLGMGRSTLYRRMLRLGIPTRKR